MQTIIVGRLSTNNIIHSRVSKTFGYFLAADEFILGLIAEDRVPSKGLFCNRPQISTRHLLTTPPDMTLGS